MTRHSEPLRTGVVQAQTARNVEMIELFIADGAEISARSLDGKDADTAR